MNNELHQLFLDLKSKLSLTIYDTHVHPYDVMGITNHSHHHRSKDLLPPSLPERLKFGVIANSLLEICFRFYPQLIRSSVKKNYSDTSAQYLLREMKSASVDKSVIIPVSPWANIEEMDDSFKNENFIILGSIDIHNTPLERINELLLGQIKSHQIKGIKLHPNLQGFMPQPKDNDLELGEKLKLIYKFAEENKLYLLFHGGYTRFTKGGLISNVSLAGKRSGTNALLKNFYSIDGTSEIFDNYELPIIIAHLGNYALIKPDYQSLRHISKRYSNILFDTAGVSPRLITKGLNIVGNNKLVFGSDALYNKESYGIAFCLDSISKSNLDFESSIQNIFSKNYENLLKTLA